MNNVKQEIIRRINLQELIKELIPSCRPSGNELSGLCPFHDDNTPSMSVNASSGLFKCHACSTTGSIFDLYGKIHGLDFPTSLKALRALAGMSASHEDVPTNSSTMQKEVDRHDYHDANGNLLYQRVRFEPGDNGRSKKYMPFEPATKIWSRLCEPVLYRLPEVNSAATVFICEGERKADIIKSWGLVGTCLDSGAASIITPTMINILTGKELIILPDNDDAGRTYRDNIVRAMQGKAASIKVIDLPGLEHKGDIVDWITTPGNDKELLLELIRQTSEWRPLAASPPALPFAFRQFSEIKSRQIHWLWPGKLARGKVAILAGHPGLGKSQLTASLAAIVTTGGRWPVDRAACEQGNVIFFSAEDDAEDTIRPRLEAAGADLEKVFILDAVMEDDGTRPRVFNMAKDLPRLGTMLEHIGNVALIVVDPITAYLGGTDSHKNADVRSLLSQLADLAASYDVAVVCVSHLNKGGSGDALMRVTGSLAFVAAARAAFLIVRDKDDKHRRLFLPIKNNIGKDESGLAFSVESHSLVDGIETSRVRWEAEAVTISADEAIAPPGDPEERSALDDAIEFLSNLLAEGPVSASQIKADATEAGIAWRTMQRAKKNLGIRTQKEGMQGSWLWKLPAKDANNYEGCQTKSVAAFGKLGNLQYETEAIYSDNGDVPELTEGDLKAAGWL